MTLSACFHVFPYEFINSPTKLYIFQESLQDALTRLDSPWLWGASLENRLSLKTLQDPVTPRQSTSTAWEADDINSSPKELSATWLS